MLNDLTDAAKSDLTASILDLVREHIRLALAHRQTIEAMHYEPTQTYSEHGLWQYHFGRAGGLLRALRELDLWTPEVEALWLAAMSHLNGIEQ